jgi:hypothetical protein
MHVDTHTHTRFTGTFIQPSFNMAGDVCACVQVSVAGTRWIASAPLRINQKLSQKLTI